MNLDDLQQTLHSMADEVSDDATTRLASVSRRVRRARRRQSLGVFGAVGAFAVGFALFPQWSAVLNPDDSAPADAGQIGSLETVRDHGLVVYRDAAGVRLLGEKVGQKGQRSISVSVTPRSGNLGWAERCLSPSTPTLTESGLTFHLIVNGREVPRAYLERLRYTGQDRLSRPNATCDDGGKPMQVQRVFAPNPQRNITSWRLLGVRPKLPATITLQATADASPAGRAALAATTLQLAVFEKPLHPVVKHKVWMDRHVVDPAGVTGAFQLVDWDFEKVPAGRHEIKVPLPATEQQVLTRSFVVNGASSGIVLEPGPSPRGEIGKPTGGPLHVERLIAPGARSVHVATAQVPPGKQRMVATLVYLRYQ